MIPKVGVDMTVDESLACVAGVVRTLGFWRVMKTVLAVAREAAGEVASRGERDFQMLNEVAEAAGLEKEGDDDHEA